MANGKPFKTAGAPSKQGQEGEKAHPPAGVPIVQSLKTGRPLPDAKDSPPALHGHSAPIPWPAAGGPDDAHKPFKV